MRHHFARFSVVEESAHASNRSFTRPPKGRHGTLFSWLVESIEFIVDFRCTGYARGVDERKEQQSSERYCSAVF